MLYLNPDVYSLIVNQYVTSQLVKTKSFKQ